MTDYGFVIKNSGLGMLRHESVIDKSLLDNIRSLLDTLIRVVVLNKRVIAESNELLAILNNHVHNRYYINVEHTVNEANATPKQTIN